MVDMSSGGIAKLPPEERLKRARELETEKRRELEEDIRRRKKSLEEELAKKKRELEELETKTKKEIDDAESLEQRTLEEITRTKQIADLEAQVKRFREANGFVQESPPDSAPAPAVQYKPSAPGGFGTQNPADAAKQHLDYLLHASTASPEGRRNAERGLYQSMRSLQEGMHDHRPVDESYVINQLQEQMRELKEHAGGASDYIARTENVLNRLVSNPSNEFDILDYRAADERRRRHGQ